MNGYGPTGKEVIQIGTDRKEFRDSGNQGGYGCVLSPGTAIAEIFEKLEANNEPSKDNDAFRPKHWCIQEYISKRLWRTGPLKTCREQLVAELGSDHGERLKIRDLC